MGRSTGKDAQSHLPRAAMTLFRVPPEVAYMDLRRRDASLSPHNYRDVDIANPNRKALLELLDKGNPFTKGIEPGTRNYLRTSDRYLIRTGALQPFSNLV